MRPTPCRLPTWAVIAALAALVACTASPASAAGISSMMADVETSFHGQLSAMGAAMSTAAKGIFWSLATISFLWSMSQLAMKAADLGEILTELIRFTVVTGVFWFILLNGSAIALAIAQSFDQLAAAAGAGGTSTPDGVMQAAGSIFSHSLATLTLYGAAGQKICSTAALADGPDIGAAIGHIGACELNLTFGNFFMLVSFLATYLVLVIVAIDMLILRVTLYLVIYLGLITLGFGGMRRTEDMAIGYLKTVGSTAIANMTMAVIAFLGLSFVQTQAAAMNTAINAAVAAIATRPSIPITTVPFSACMEGLIAALVVLFLIKRVPHILGQMIGGVNAASQVSGAGAALVAGGVAAMGLAGGAMVAAGASSAAAKATKGVEATMAGAAGGGDGPSGGGPSGGGGMEPSPSGPLDGGGSSSGQQTGGGGLSNFARMSGDMPAAARTVDLGGSTGGGLDGQSSGTSGGPAPASAMPANPGGGGSGPEMGGAGEPAPSAELAGGLQDGPGEGAGDTGAGSVLVAAGSALKLTAGATAAALAVHDGVEPLTAARSAYNGGRRGNGRGAALWPTPAGGEGSIGGTVGGNAT